MHFIIARVCGDTYNKQNHSNTFQNEYEYVIEYNVDEFREFYG